MPGRSKALLVDDDPKEVDLFCRALARCGSPFSVTSVSGGEQALAYLRRQGPYSKTPTPDFMLLDLDMPEVGGFEVLEAVKADPSLCGLPVILYSAQASPQDVQRAYGSGANCYMLKPCGPESLQSFIHTVGVFWCGGRSAI